MKTCHSFITCTRILQDREVMLTMGRPDLQTDLLWFSRGVRILLQEFPERMLDHQLTGKLAGSGESVLFTT